MAAFPAGTPTVGSLHEKRDQLRDDLRRLQGLVALVHSYVDRIEAQRLLSHVQDNGTATTDTVYDSTVLTAASALHTALNTVALTTAVKNAIKVK